MNEKIAFYITGFGKFHNVTDNPAKILVESLPESVPNRPSIKSITIIEVSRKAVNTYLGSIHDALLEDGSKHVIHLHFGVAAGAQRISIEEIGCNNATFRVPDEQGEQPEGEVVVTKHPYGKKLRTGLCVQHLVCELAAKEHKVEASINAGNFLCNYIYCASLSKSDDFNRAQNMNPHVDLFPKYISLFVHIPLFDAVSLSDQQNFVSDLLWEIENMIQCSPKRFSNMYPIALSDVLSHSEADIHIKSSVFDVVSQNSS